MSCENTGDELATLKHENERLRAYLRAFVRATYSHPRDCYGGQTPAQDAASMHRVNPGMTYSFGLNELEGDDPVITGGQVMRAMELLGEAPELTPTEEAKNLQAATVLRDVQGTIALAGEAIGGRAGAQGVPAFLEEVAAEAELFAMGAPRAALLREHARRLTYALAFLTSMSEAIPAALASAPPAPKPDAGGDLAGQGEPVKTPQAGSEEEAFWLEAAMQYGFEQTDDNDKPTLAEENYRATGAQILALMAAAREQGRNDIRPVPSKAAPGMGSLAVIQDAMASGRFRIRSKDRATEADPDAGMIWPIEIEMPCINGLSCWFGIGSLYTPDAAARGYTDGALSDELAHAFAAHILRSLASACRPAKDLAGQGEPVAWAYEYFYADEWSPRVDLNRPEDGVPNLRNIRPLFAAPAPSRPADREEIARLMAEELGMFWDDMHENGFAKDFTHEDIYRATDAVILALRDPPRDGGDGWSTDMEAGKREPEVDLFLSGEGIRSHRRPSHFWDPEQRGGGAWSECADRERPDPRDRICIPSRYVSHWRPLPAPPSPNAGDATQDAQGGER